MSQNNSTVSTKKILFALPAFLRNSAKNIDINSELNVAIQTPSNTITLVGNTSSPVMGQYYRTNEARDMMLQDVSCTSTETDVAVIEDGGRIEQEWVRASKKPDQQYVPNLQLSNRSFLPSDLKAPINQRANKLRLIDALVSEGIIDDEIAQKAVALQKHSNGKRRLVDVLIEDMEADSELVFEATANYYSFKIVDPTPYFGDKDRLQFIQQKLQFLSRTHYDLAVIRKVLPYELYKNGVDKLVVITPDPSHTGVNTVARAFGFRKYEIRYVSLVHWKELWRQLAFDQGAKQLGLDVGGEFTQVNREEYQSQLERDLEEEVGRGKLGELLESILVDGVRTGASDIHVIPKGIYRTEFHFRIDGKLSLWSVIKDVRAEAILSVTKDRGKNLDRFEKFSSQDGYGQRTIDNKIVRFRFSTMPIYGNDMQGKLESIVIRILRGAETSAGIETLGMDKKTLAVFQKSIRKPQGMVVFTGPTGSGKTTSQVAAIKTIMDPSLNIVTIEDPVEYLIEGCRQVKLNHKLDFEGALRGLLRHDPDIIMVGEMRDQATADIAVKLANTGHLIFSTLHTNDAVSAITRLYNMGIEPFLLAYTVNIIVAQRLIRKLCDRCKLVDEHVDIDHLMECGLSPNETDQIMFYKPVGCVHCVKGYRGRVGVFEVLNVTKDIRTIILKSKDFVDEDAIRTLALQSGMISLRQSVIQLVKQGVTSIEAIAGMAIED